MVRERLVPYKWENPSPKTLLVSTKMDEFKQLALHESMAEITRF